MEFSGKSMGGAREAGAPPLFLDQTKARCFYGDTVHRFVMQK